MKISDILKSLFESNTYNVVKSKKFNKLKIKYSNKKSNIKLLDSLVQELRDSGEITGHNAHRINQPISSEHAGKDVTGWVSVWISKTDDLRLAYNRFKDGTIEVKFGKASDIGYTH
jgi:hypothetical protein